jgi:hypothetical protein
LNDSPPRCESRRVPAGAMRRSSPRRRRDRGRGGGENIFAKVLTHRKSVIRFRPSRRFLRKQVSRVIATISKTKRPPTRALGMTDAGFASPTKTQTPSRYRTRAVCDAGVFSSAPATGANRRGPNRPGLPPSVPTRLARRRLPAGPTPAAFHCNWAL